MSLFEVLVGMLLIAIVALIVMTGVGSVLTSMSATDSIDRASMLQIYTARRLYLLKRGSQITELANEINSSLSSQYPKIKQIEIESSNSFYRKFKVIIETKPGKEISFHVYQGF
ncbi:type II secretion system protein [Pseudothermotoga thermarum]|nr:hypothetical protein [Pseudothermotoga thermarum]